MSRSLKKGPYIEPKLESRVIAQNEGGKKSVIKTWSRASMISPDFVGQTIAVHNGNKFIPVYVTENMVGHKLGEFAPTRTFVAIQVTRKIVGKDGFKKTHNGRQYKAEKKQKAIAILNDCPTSPLKMRIVADTIRGVEINRALGILASL